jgi:hypothetical protein
MNSALFGLYAWYLAGFATQDLFMIGRERGICRMYTPWRPTCRCRHVNTYYTPTYL